MSELFKSGAAAVDEEWWSQQEAKREKEEKKKELALIKANTDLAPRYVTEESLGRTIEMLGQAVGELVHPLLARVKALEAREWCGIWGSRENLFPRVHAFLLTARHGLRRGTTRS